VRKVNQKIAHGITNNQLAEETLKLFKKNNGDI